MLNFILWRVNISKWVRLKFVKVYIRVYDSRDVLPYCKSHKIRNTFLSNNKRNTNGEKVLVETVELIISWDYMSVQVTAFLLEASTKYYQWWPTFYKSLLHCQNLNDWTAMLIAVIRLQAYEHDVENGVSKMSSSFSCIGMLFKMEWWN